jgi:hypothetical protein
VGGNIAVWLLIRHLNHAFAGRSQQLLSPRMSAPDPALFQKINQRVWPAG